MTVLSRQPAAVRVLLVLLGVGLGLNLAGGYGWIVASWTSSSSVRVLQYLRQRPCRLSRRPRRHR